MNSASPVSDGEFVVLLDDSGEPVGTAPKSEVHHSATPLHLAFSCYVFDGEGGLLITRRALEKRTWPGVWTNSCCGHPAPGESMADAVHRRVGEELGVHLGELRLRLADFRYRAVDVTGVVENELCPVYTAVTRETPRPDPDEIADWKWVAWEDFAMLATRTPWAISPWAAEQIPLLSSRFGEPEREDPDPAR
ncbi:isopentenyl-diphosphate delta-isomerase [Actinopolyspora xinjiangensis]|uniref:Isopentenyl-diphosphate Delta-isomerase n=1 Tax=Actinopolyspora xinjiangensis TaxID=405564 RepID=A0A1H0WNU5_9ACTN|nr:isopentenyl-diphosphate Delta-isomerase [Actinopolyspora xinjiangensis]SDP92318.1 isopentenyl-diphosphate delta-isomerase [Actinopolyspora xinjiangensis]